MGVSLDNSVGDVSVHNDVVLLDDSDSVVVERLPVVVLGLDDVASEHLRVLNLDLGVVEDEVVIVYILNDLYWLILILLLRFRGPAPARVNSVQARVHLRLGVALTEVSFLLHSEVVSVGPLGRLVALVTDQVAIAIRAGGGEASGVIGLFIFFTFLPLARVVLDDDLASVVQLLKVLALLLV